LSAAATKCASNIPALAGLQKHGEDQENASQNENAFENKKQNQDYLPARQLRI